MKILLLAGEESGALYARQIRERLTGHEVRGFEDYGFKTEDLGVMGVDEVLKSLFYLLRVKRTMERAIDDWHPDVVCTIDYPGMNLKLAAYAKARGIRTVHVVCPQVWAWKAGRIPKIQKIFDRLCCFLPFEPQIFRAGFAEFVGHPLVETFDRETRERAPSGASEGTENRALLLALLPGSRAGEISKHLPVMLETVRQIRRNSPDLALRAVIPAANDKAHALILKFMSRLRLDGVSVQQGGARDLLRRADCAVVASGTATLEAALARCPTILVYKAAPLFAFVARRVIKGVRFIGLANIIWDKSLAAKGIVPSVSEAPMPEILQENLTVENLKERLLPLLEDEQCREEARKRLAAAMDLLRGVGNDAIGRISELVLDA